MPGSLVFGCGHVAAEELAGVAGDAVLRDDVTRERLSGLRVVNRRGDAREIAGAQCRGRNQSLPAKGAGHLPPRFPVEEEEGLVFAVIHTGDPHRPTQIRAELVAVQARRLGRRHARLKPVQSREAVVAVELPGRAVHRVGAAAGGEVHLAAGRAADFGRIGAALHLEFLDGVDGRREAEAIAVQVHRLDAVVVEPVLRVTRAIGGHADRLTHRAAQSPHRDAARCARVHARGKQRELYEGAPVERQLHHLLAVDHRAYRSVLGLHEDRPGFHKHALGSLAQRNLHVHARDLVHADLKRLDLGALETRRRDGQRIAAHRQE